MKIDEVVTQIVRLGELNQATNDALVIICLHLQQEQPQLAKTLQQTFQNLSQTTLIQATDAMRDISGRLAAVLSEENNNVVLDSLSRPGPEDHRAAFRVIAGAKGKDPEAREQLNDREVD